QGEAPALVVHALKFRALEQSRRLLERAPRRFPTRSGRRNGHLLAETGFYGDAVAPLGAAALQHRAATFGLHPPRKAVRLGAASPVRLERALGHAKTALLLGLRRWEQKV